MVGVGSTAVVWVFERTTGWLLLHVFGQIRTSEFAGLQGTRIVIGVVYREIQGDIVEN